MITKIYYGIFKLQHFVNYLASAFQDQNLDVRTSRHGEKNIIRFMSSKYAKSGGQFALNVTVVEFDGGVKVEIANPENLGIAASFGKTALVTLINPRNIIARLDDLAQDFENITLDDSILQVIQQYMKSNQLTLQLSASLSRSICEYCDVVSSPHF